MTEDSQHASYAPDVLQKEAGAKMNELRTKANKDEFGRVDWLGISRQMKAWWTDKGYAYP